jgi:ABC-type nitrate/sulfonate/bicarbonate transport system ATPase subunit
VVLSQRPATIIKTFEINLKRVRDRSAPEFLDLKKEITSLLEIDL